MNTKIVTEYLLKRTLELLVAKQLAIAIGDEESAKEAAVRASELRALILVAQTALEDSE